MVSKQPFEEPDKERVGMWLKEYRHALSKMAAFSHLWLLST